MDRSWAETTHAGSDYAMSMADSHGDYARPAAPAAGEITVRQVHGGADLRSVVQLRGLIDLSAAASAEKDFARLEKKETNWVSSSFSSAMAS